MIQELSKLGKMLRAEKDEKQWVHDALKPEPISMEIVITPAGDFQNFESFEKKQTIAEAITAKKGKARLLLDKAEEVLCYGGETSKRKHKLFLDKIDRYKDMEELKPVVKFYMDNRSNGLEKALKDFEAAVPDEKNRKGNMGFRLKSEGTRIHEIPNILRKIIGEYETQQEALLSQKQTKCSICGKSDCPAGDFPHGMIKRVPDGHSSGSALVSYNETAFESYKLKGNSNSSICTNCAKTYVEGMNWLLSSGNEVIVKTSKGKEKKNFRYTNRKNFGSDTAMVFWTRKNEKLNEIDILEAPDPDDVARLIESVTSGTKSDSDYLEADRFYSCTLSGAAARIAVRDWIETSLFDFRKAIAKWFQDIAIVEYKKDLGKFVTHYPRLYDLARSCQRRNSDGSADKKDTSLARVATYLWNAALKHSSLPLWILTKVLQRARLDKYGVTADRAALIKIILNRNNKGGGFVVNDKMEQGDRPVAYVCGQIFAKLESIQYAALGDRNAGIRERYFTYAMTSPASAFGRLFNLNSKHFTKLKREKPGLAVHLDKEIQGLCKEIDINEFPATFLLEEQGQFAIGYYHQKQVQFSNSKTKENKEEI